MHVVYVNARGIMSVNEIERRLLTINVLRSSNYYEEDLCVFAASGIYYCLIIINHCFNQNVLIYLLYIQCLCQ